MTLSVTINGKTVQAEPGMTVLEVARANGIYIPTLCYSPRLRPAGACRMCVVKIEDMRGFPTSCTTPAADGMRVYTDTEDVQRLRREILALILSEHPYTCLVCQSDCADFQSTVRKAAVTTGCQYCPANGQCELQELVNYLGLRDMPYPISYRGLPVEQHDPFFDRDYNLCVLCGRCVRACQEIRHAGVLAFVKRGAETIVSTAFGRSHLEVDCHFCGACVDVCPTGALADKRGKWEGVPTAVVPSVCAYCSVGCAIDIQVKGDRRVIRAVGRSGGSTNDGQLCVRGRFGLVDVVHSLNRLKKPMVRRNGRLVEVSWEEALGVVAEQLGPYRSAPPWDGDDRFALIASATASNEESYALQKFARAVMKSNNVALSAGFPDHENGSDLSYTLAAIGGTTIRDLRKAACIVAIGTNVFESHPILGLEILHARNRRSIDSPRGASLITIDARQTRLAQESDVWLQPAIATDFVLVAGMIKALVNVGGISNRPDLPDLDEVTALTGVEQEKIIEAAQLLVERLSASQGEEQPATVVVVYGSGITHQPTARQTITALNNLAAVINQAFGPGTLRIMGIPGESNLVGAHDVGVHPTLLPGYRAVSDPEARAVLEAAWGTALNPRPGRSYRSILDGIRAGQIEALYLAGATAPLPELANLKFLVVQDIVSSETLQYAHVVLPLVTFAEMDGSLTNLEGRVQCLRKAIAPTGASRPGWMIACDLARYLGDSTWHYETAAQVMDEIAALIPAYAGVNYSGLDMDGIVRRFESDVETQRYVPIKLERVPQLTDDQFPLTLITERNLFYYHGVCLTEQVAGMNLIKEEETLYLNPKDIRQLGVSDGDLVRVVSPHGSSEYLVRVAAPIGTPACPAGTPACPAGTPACPTGTLACGPLPERVAFASFNRVNRSPLFPALAPDRKAYPIRIEIASKPQEV